jgi:hypothetical protein
LFIYFFTLNLNTWLAFIRYASCKIVNNKTNAKILLKSYIKSESIKYALYTILNNKTSCFFGKKNYWSQRSIR